MIRRLKRATKVRPASRTRVSTSRLRRWIADCLRTGTPHVAYRLGSGPWVRMRPSAGPVTLTLD